MADFYVNYGSSDAYLLGNLKFGTLSIKFHQVGEKYVISKNRKILKVFSSHELAIKYFRNVIDFELSDYLPFNSI